MKKAIPYGPKWVVLGAGESGVGAAFLASAKGYDVLVSDAGTIKPVYKNTLNEAGIAFEEGGHTEHKVLAADLVIKSPGIPTTVPMLKAIRKAGIDVVSEIEMASWFTEAKLIAVTGSNGKTTTSTLIYHVLKEAGFNVKLAGNVGNSFAREILLGDAEYFVLEVSSFQLDDIKTFAPDISLLLNITSDHLDRYEGRMENYARAKLRIAENQTKEQLFIYGGDCPTIAKHIQERQGEARAISFQETQPDGTDGGFLYNDQLTIQLKKKTSACQYLN